MKKIFAVSILSLMTVITASDALANASPNYNLATVEYVEEKVGDVFWNDVVRVMDVANDGEQVSDAGKDQYVPSVARMENAISEATANIDMSTKVDKTSVISSTGTVTSDDTQIPTVKRVESRIEDALGWVKDTVVAIDQGAEKKDQILVTDSVGAVKTVPQIGMEQVADLEGALNSKVANEQIVATPGGNSMGDYATSLQAGAEADADMVSAVPSVNAVAESFVPSQANSINDDYHNSGDNVRPGLYAIMVNVKDDGQKEYIWQAVQYNTEVTSTGGTQSPL